MAVNFDFSETSKTVNLSFFKSPADLKEKKEEIENPKISLKDPKTLLFNGEEIKLFDCVEIVGIENTRNKTEVTLNKKEQKKWNTIDGKTTKVVVNDETYKEGPEEEKTDIMGLFQSLYQKGDENTKRAMNKSLFESGGTTLSTDWNQVKDKKVKPEE